MLGMGIGAWLLATASAEPVALGVFVGSNRPGAGQETLQFSVRDATRLQQVLEEIGGLEPENAIQLVDPDANAIVEALKTQRARLEGRRSRDEQTVFVFYYSGHAKSQALTLGPSELPLHQLRGLLEDMPSTVTLAVLDACQSGAISGVKGVRPAEEFSYNTSQVLNASGLALIASSTGTELSQESEELGGSFFTHHLVTGLRGPADADNNGAVSLVEAYHYAYHRTLATTASTRVGWQHVTLETQLRGHGDMVLTRPSTSTAWLVLDDRISGRVLVVQREESIVMAEVVTRDGAEVTLALPPGGYAVVGRNDAGAYRCEVDLEAEVRSTLDEARCEILPEGSLETVKRTRYETETLGIELAFGFISPTFGPEDYDATLAQFGFSPTWDTAWAGSLALTGRLGRRLSWVVTGSTMDRQTAYRDFVPDNEDGVREDRPQDEFAWQAFRIGFYPRYSQPFPGGRFVATVQAGGGLSAVLEDLSTTSDSTRSTTVGYHLAGAAALSVVIRTKGIDLAPFFQTELIYSPTLRNRLDEVRNVGGLAMNLGIRVTP